jgi:3-oxoacyl-[acyl-carrier-protein] synthase-3
MSSLSASIIGTGSYVPEKVLSNADLERLVETNDEWIVTRTGIRERRIAAPEQNTSDLAAEAAKAAMLNAGVSPEELDMIIVATVTPDMFFPSTACFVQTKIGAKNAVCFDVSAACSGFLFALETARQFIASGARNTVLVIGAEKLSTIVDWSDRNTCVLFGDGAGAAILRHKPGARGILHTHMGSDGRQSDILYIPGGACRTPVTAENAELRLNTIKMNGKETYKQAVTAMMEAGNRVLEAGGVRAEELACIIPHQANARIVEGVRDSLGLPAEKVFMNLDRYGNTSSGSIPLALEEAWRTGRVGRGSTVVICGFGGGLAWGTAVWRL